ncbi:MAG TPA: aminopeptidase family protein P, partial [Xanthobacteraceae bacterium]|nr:aminopeptidase family protein P [Xanthobacteraceae bacterium]
SDPQAVCWLFNIRGGDVPHTPVTLAFALVPQEGRPSLYIDGGKLGNDVRPRLEELAEVRAPQNFAGDLAALGKAQRAVRLDPAACPEAIARLIADNGGKIVRGSDPIAPLKAVKNAVEIAGARAAQLRDGVAVTRFLAWFDREAPSGQLTEIDAVEALESFRRDTGLLKDVSFPTIAGAGADGAIVHYRVTRNSNRRIAPGELFLVDSGGQYEDGTTDITRTIAVGTPSAEMRRNFTLVLKGHIAIARAVFPDGTTGAQLDSFARAPLWAAGLDFDHGTGHGVGSYLSVHEGPARISKLGTVALKRGMILSNEPGYYKTGAYGIRIENLVLVTEAPAVPGSEKPLNGFDTLTLAPLDQRLIDPARLTSEETSWLDRYHENVAKALAPLVDTATRAWLDRATKPLR